MDLFNQIVTKYPSSEYANDARYKIQVARDQLAGKEMSIGRFYLARKNYTAAVNRFREVLAKYQTTRHTEEALLRLTEAYSAWASPARPRRLPRSWATTSPTATGIRMPMRCFRAMAWSRTKTQAHGFRRLSRGSG